MCFSSESVLERRGELVGGGYGGFGGGLALARDDWPLASLLDERGDLERLGFELGLVGAGQQVQVVASDAVLRGDPENRCLVLLLRQGVLERREALSELLGFGRGLLDLSQATLCLRCPRPVIRAFGAELRD